MNLLRSNAYKFLTFRNCVRCSFYNDKFFDCDKNRYFQSIRYINGTGVSNLSRENIKLPNHSEVNQIDIFKTLISYVWPEDRPELKRRVIGALSLLAAGKVCNAFVPFMFKYAVDHLTTTSNTVYDISTIPLNDPTLWASCLILGYGVAKLGTTSFDELRRVVFAKVAQSSVRSVSRKVFLHLHNLDLGFHLNRRTGALDRAIGLGSRGINTALSLLVFNLIPVAIELSLVSAILWYKCGPIFAGSAIAFAGLYTYFTIALTQRRIGIRKAMNKADQDAGNLAHDSLINYETVKYFNNEIHEANQYDSVLAKYESAALKTQTSLSFLNWGQQVLFTATLTLLMWQATNSIIAGQMSVGDLVLVNGLLFQLNVPLNFLGSTFREIRQALVDTQTMFQLLSVPSHLKSSPNAADLNVSPTTSNIEFQDVAFSYVDGSPILDGLSFTVAAGEKVAIVGGSGSGKSTIVRLLYRFYDPDRGRVLVNGQDISQVRLDSLRERIGVVPQDTVLFHNTIKYNIHYGNLNANDEEIAAAVKMADLTDSIDRMPNKYDTQVGERGLMLSGGEKQRVSIARAFLKNPLIFIYDEATSSLDSLTEQNILSSLRSAVKNRTTIVIAHRLSTVIDADKIVVLKDGKVAEIGTHYELLTKPQSYYAQLWKMQNRVVQF